jgi:3-phenylpropionate/trans-cinnamate dioxygenase ferredoxin subunit
MVAASGGGADEGQVVADEVGGPAAHLHAGEHLEVCDMAPEFTTVAKAGDIPSGQLVAFDVEGTQVAIANVDGIFYGFGDTCTHAHLAEGDLEATTVVCPCHGSVFDVTTGAAWSYRVRVEGDALQVEV